MDMKKMSQHLGLAAVLLTGCPTSQEPVVIHPPSPWQNPLDAPYLTAGSCNFSFENNPGTELGYSTLADWFEGEYLQGFYRRDEGQFTSLDNPIDSLARGMGDLRIVDEFRPEQYLVGEEFSLNALISLKRYGGLIVEHTFDGEPYQEILIPQRDPWLGDEFCIEEDFYTGRSIHSNNSFSVN